MESMAFKKGRAAANSILRWKYSRGYPRHFQRKGGVQQQLKSQGESIDVGTLGA